MIDEVNLGQTRTNLDPVARRASLHWAGANSMTSAGLETDPSYDSSSVGERTQSTSWFELENGTGMERPLDLAPMYWDLEAVLDQAKDEVFEDGILSGLVRGLSLLTARFGYGAITTLVQRIETPAVDAEIASECIAWLGRLNHPSSLDLRKRFFERMLFGQSERLRDSAALAITSAGAKESLPALRIAAARETNSLLRSDLALAISELETME